MAVAPRSRWHPGSDRGRAGVLSAVVALASCQPSSRWRPVSRRRAGVLSAVEERPELIGQDTPVGGSPEVVAANAARRGVLAVALREPVQAEDARGRGL